MSHSFVFLTTKSLKAGRALTLFVILTWAVSKLSKDAGSYDRAIPDLEVEVKLTVSEGDKVVCLMEYCGTHAKFHREAIWREIWIVRLVGWQDRWELALPDAEAYCRQLGYSMTPPNS